jgi:hypothetical protein
MSAAGIARAPEHASVALPFDDELAIWQGKIASAAKSGNGLDTFRVALDWVKQGVPQNNGLREKAKKEIREAAERHLAEVHGVAVLDAIYFCVFPEDVINNDQLDADVLSRDQDAEIRRLAKLPAIEYDRLRRATAESLGITVKALDADVKAARVESNATKGQGRPLELPKIEPWPEPVNGAVLLADICNTVKKYLVLPVDYSRCYE